MKKFYTLKECLISDDSNPYIFAWFVIWSLGIALCIAVGYVLLFT